MTQNKLEIEIENVGGFKGVHKFNLTHGLNVVSATNAAGKTSFVKALELVSLDDRELRGKGHYMNLMADSNREYAKVKITNDKVVERKFRRVRDDLYLVSGDPLYQDGNKVTTVCFATPENELINRMLAGQSIQSYVEDFSASKYYESAIKLLESLRYDFDRQHQLYRGDLIRLEQEQLSFEEEEKELLKLEEELKRIPTVDVLEVIKDQKIVEEINKKENKKRAITNNINNITKEIMKIQSDIEVHTDKINYYETRLKEIGKDRKRIEDALDKIAEEKERLERIIKECDTQLSKIDDELKLVNENFQKRQKYGEEKLCIACGQPLALKQLQEWEIKLRHDKEEYESRMLKAKRNLEDCEHEEDKLKRESLEYSKYSDELEKEQTSKATKERQKNDKENRLKKLEYDRSKLEEEIEKLYANVDENSLEIVKRRDEIEHKIETITIKIDVRRSRISELQESAVKADAIVDKIEFVESSINYMRKRKEELIDAVRKTFNKRISEIYKKLGFKDFEEIEIRSDYRIYIRRPGFNESWPLDALSTSERVTLAVMFLIAGKQEYMPDYPFFVLDEIVTSYDPERFEKLKEYVSNVTEYVVVTQLVKSSDALVIGH